MSVWSMTRINLPPVSKMSSLVHEWSLGYAALMVLMWWSMMLAMMLVPLCVQLHRAENVARAASSPAFLSGYALVWLMFSFVAAGLQWVLEHFGLLHPFMMWSLSPVLSACALIAAGVFQVSSIKATTRSACQPEELSLQSGLQFGQNCLYSTAPLMLVFFAGGLMNLTWMLALTLVVLVERVTKPSPTFDRILAVLLISLGLWCLAI